MGLSPITSIGAVDKVSSSRTDREVAPPLALDRTDRMGDDAYDGSDQEAERGLKDDDEGQADETVEAAETRSIPPNAENTVNFIV